MDTTTHIGGKLQLWVYLESLISVEVTEGDYVFPFLERAFSLPNTLAVVGVSPRLMQGNSI